MIGDLGRYDEHAIPPPEGAWSYEVDDPDAAYGPHHLWPFAGAVRVAPDTDYRSWRNEYIVLNPTSGALHPTPRSHPLVMAHLDLFVREQGTGGYLIPALTMFDLADQRTVTSRTLPAEVVAQHRAKASRLWRFIDQAREDRDAGRPLLTASARHQAAGAPCPTCDGDGYLDESTMTHPSFCSCRIGQLAQAMHADPWDRAKHAAFHEARDQAQAGRPE